ncbi:DNA-binding transcriptional LysR family regulator [Nocardia sp. GAS34]|uniref:LysR family transcriptional regulator n=1 Tax=unclassified Nocardia TaxID=2637762 RepID=UPI003D25B515
MTYLDTQHVRSFVAVAQQGNITRAAGDLHLTQQAVSLHIQQLERTLGVALLVRTSRGVILTAAGEELARGGAEFLTDLATLALRVQAVARRQEGLLRLTCCPYATTLFAAHIADAMEEAVPGIDVELLTVPSQPAEMDLLLRGDADAGFMWLPVGDDRLNHAYIRRDHRTVAVAEGHPLAGRDSVTLAELADDPVVLPNVLLSETAVRHWLAEPRPGGKHAVRGPVTPEITDALLMVARGRGVWLAPSTVGDWVTMPGICWVPVVDAEPSYLAVVWVPSAPTELISRLVSEVRAITGWIDEPAYA